MAKKQKIFSQKNFSQGAAVKTRGRPQDGSLFVAAFAEELAPLKQGTAAVADPAKGPVRSALAPSLVRPTEKSPAAGARKARAEVRIGRQIAGRRGKGVTVITGVPLSGAALEALATELKKRCGSGGTLKDGIIEIQGDHRDTLLEVLSRHGWNVKRSGG